MWPLEVLKQNIPQKHFTWNKAATEESSKRNLSAHLSWVFVPWSYICKTFFKLTSSQCKVQSRTSRTGPNSAVGFRTRTSTWKLENIFIVRHLQSSPQFLVLLLNLGFTRRTSRRVASSAELLLIRVGPTSTQTLYSQSEFCFLGRYLGKKGETSGAQQNQQVTKCRNNWPKDWEVSTKWVKL